MPRFTARTASLSRYLVEVRRAPFLTTEEEAMLTESGSRDVHSLDRLVSSNLPFVIKVAKDYRNRGVPFEDLISEGNLGLMEAALRYDRGHGTKFITYAMWWIRKHILQALEDQSRIVRVPGSTWESRRRARRRPVALPTELSLEDTTSSTTLPLAERLADARFTGADHRLVSRENAGFLAGALGELSAHERRVLRHRFGLEGETELTLRETGERLGISRERVRQVEVKALERLRRLFRARQAAPGPQRYDAGDVPARRPAHSPRAAVGAP